MRLREVEECSEDILAQGYLLLEQERKRYVVLLRTKLVYCAVRSNQSEKDRRVRRVAEVRNGRVVSFHSTKQCGFRIDRGLSTEFFCLSRSDLEKWISALSAVCCLSSIDHDYRILHQLGSGSYSQVFVASDRKSECLVTVKRIVKNQWEPFPPRLESEVAILRSLDHPGTVRLLRVYEEWKDVCIVLSYKAGVSLQTFALAHGPLPEVQVREVIGSLLHTLLYIHSQDIVHRDIKPDNVIIDCDNGSLSCCIIDFGLAAKTADLGPGVCGTPGFIAPEILRQEKCDQRVDIFSLGMVAYTLAQGRNPFAHIDRQTTLTLNEKCVLNFDRSRWEGVSEEMLNLLQLMTAKDPRNRPNTRDCLDHPWFRLELTPHPCQSFAQQRNSYSAASDASTNGDEKSPPRFF